MEQNMPALPSKCSGYFLLSTKIKIILNIHASEFCVSWVSWAGFKFPLVQPGADTFVCVWFALAGFHCLEVQVSVHQGRQGTAPAQRLHLHLCSQHASGWESGIPHRDCCHPLLEPFLSPQIPTGISHLLLLSCSSGFLHAHSTFRGMK